MAEKHSSLTPYNYVDGNPLSNIDPDGREIFYGAEARAVFNQLRQQFPVNNGSKDNKSGNEPANKGTKQQSSGKEEKLDKNLNFGAGIYSGNNIFSSTYEHFQTGLGRDFHVDASSLDFSKVSKKDLKRNEDGTFGLDLYKVDPKSQIALALGKIKLINEGKGRFAIAPDLYDFNIEWQNGFSKRNIATLGANVLHHSSNPIIPILFGGPFQIKFHGTIKIKR